MIQRALQTDIEKFMKAFPAIVVLGPRQVGKTTLVKLISKKSKKKSTPPAIVRSSAWIDAFHLIVSCANINADTPNKFLIM